MKVGDLVKFHTSSWIFKHASDGYANPGMVLSIESAKASSKERFIAEVYWRDGNITREYDSYLRHLKERK